MNWILYQILHEKSTYAGVFMVLSAFGIHSFTGDQKDAIVSLCLAITGAIHMAPDKLPDRSKD